MTPKATAEPSTAVGERQNPGRTAAWLAKQVEIGLASADLSLSQYRVLGFLDESSAVSSDLAERLAVRPPSVTAMVDGLVARGLVERRTVVSDRRQVDHVLTDSGRRALDTADTAVTGRLADIAWCLGDRWRSNGPSTAWPSGGGRSAPTGWPGWPSDEDTRPPAPPTGNSRAGQRVRPHRRGGPQRGAPATIDPDKSLTWLRRAMPIMGAHKGIFITSLVLSFLGLVLQVQMPNLLNHAITNSIQATPCPSAITSGGSSASGWSVGSSATSPACSCSRPPTTSSTTCGTSSTST